MRINDAALALALTAALAARLPGGTADAQHGSAPPARTPDAVIRDVLLGATKDPARPAEAWIAELCGAGKTLVPGLVRVLRTGEIPGESGGAALEAPQEAIVIGALERVRRGDLKGKIELLIEAGARPEARRAGYRLLGELGTREDVLLLCDALRAPDPEEDPDREEAGCFRSAVARILKRDELGYPLVRTLLHKEATPLRYYLMCALSDTQSAAALGILSSELGARPEESLWLLTECARIAAAVDLPVDGAVPSSIRVHLRSDDAMEVRAAAECLGNVEDFDSVPDLVELLDHAHPDVRRAALEALRAITGASLLPDVERWRAWLRAESAWFAGAETSVADALSGSDPLGKMAAIRELAGHPFYRREAARMLSTSLVHESDDLVRVGCAALRQLRAAGALPFLETCAASASKSVADEARAAIGAIRERRPRSGPAR